MANQTINLGEAKSAFDVIAAAIPKAIGLLTKDVATTALKTVISGTPVDTGLARSNWHVSLNNPSIDVLDAWSPYPKYSGPKLSETANETAAVDAGLLVLSSFKDGDVVFIQNNIPYIGSLNDGTSKQANRGFVEDAVKASSVVAALKFARYLASV